MIIQVYEIQGLEEAEQLIAMGIDHIGSVLLSADNWKQPSLKAMIRRVSELGARSSLIPLFSRTDLIRRCLDYYQPDIIHFCELLPDGGRQPADLEDIVRRQQSIKETFPQIDVMRTIPIAQAGCSNGNSVRQLARIFEPVSDFFLTDTLMVPKGAPAPGERAAAQPVDGFVGITGVTCNWETARDLVEASGIPVILAGGITPDNVSEGIRQVRPAGVDSCTGTNATDHHGRPIRFQKDMTKVQHLIAAARKAAIHE